MQEFSKGTKVLYPYFKAEDPDEAFQLMCRNLEPGDIPLCLSYKGQLYKIMTISLSAYNVDKLIKVCPLSVVTEAGQYNISSMQDYLEGVHLWTC